MREADPEVSFLTRRRAVLLFSLVLLLRVTVAAQFRGNFDSQSFLLSADAVVHGENVYAATSRYNYSPLWAYVLGAIWAASIQNTSLFVLLVGLLQIAVDIGSSAFILRIAERRLGFPGALSRRAALLFFSNPISVLVSGAQGQFDGTAVLCLLGAIYWATGAEFPKKRARVVALLALSLLVKHATVFHPLLFWRRFRRPGLSDVGVATPYVLFVLSFLPFAAAWQSIVRNVFLYSAGVERASGRPGGLQSYIGFSGPASAVFASLFLVAVAAVVWITRKMELPRACLVLFLGLLVFLPSYAPQYLAWPVALGSLYPSPAFGLYTAAGALWHSFESLELHWPVRVAPYGAWVAAVVWLIAEVRRPSASPNPTGRFMTSVTTPEEPTPEELSRARS